MKAIKLENLGLLRAFAITIVVLRHCFSPYTGVWDISSEYNYNQLTDIVGNYISTISMPLFVFISGLLFSYLRNTLGKYPNYYILLNKKFNRLLKPYILLAPLYIVFILNITSINGFLSEFFSGTGHLWFLTMIFTVFVIFYPFEKFFKSKPILGFFIVSFCFLLYPIFSRLGLVPLSKALQYGVFFYVGYFFYTHGKLFMKKIKGKLIFLFLIHLALFYVAYFSIEFIEISQLKALIRGYSKLPLGLISIMFIYLFFSELGEKESIKNNKLIAAINKNSYYIYLIHQPILKIFFTWGALRTLPSISVISMAFLLAFSISFVLADLSMRSKWGRRLVGTR